MGRYVYCTNSGCDRQDKPFTRDLCPVKRDQLTCPWCAMPEVEPWTAAVQEYSVYTDGSCPKNAEGGPGGWAAIFVKGIDDPQKPTAFDPERVVHVVVGGAPSTTNNRMEILGVLSAITAFSTYSRIEVVSDSQYTLNGFETWVHGWPAKNWINSQRKPVKNRDLWEQVLTVLGDHPHDISYRWVKGHQGHNWNELADKMAREQADSFL